MMTFREIAATALKRFLPALLVMMSSIMLLEAAVHGTNGIRGLRSIYVPTLVMELALITVGFAGGVWRRAPRAASAAASGWLRAFVAATAAVLLLGLLSIFSQGAHRPKIAAMSLLSGALVGALFYSSSARALPRTSSDVS